MAGGCLVTGRKHEKIDRFKHVRVGKSGDFGENSLKFCEIP